MQEYVVTKGRGTLIEQGVLDDNLTLIELFLVKYPVDKGYCILVGYPRCSGRRRH